MAVEAVGEIFGGFGEVAGFEVDYADIVAGFGVAGVFCCGGARWAFGGGGGHCYFVPLALAFRSFSSEGVAFAAFGGDVDVRCGGRLLDFFSADKAWCDILLRFSFSPFSLLAFLTLLLLSLFIHSRLSRACFLSGVGGCWVRVSSPMRNRISPSKNSLI